MVRSGYELRRPIQAGSKARTETTSYVPVVFGASGTAGSGAGCVLVYVPADLDAHRVLRPQQKHCHREPPPPVIAEVNVELVKAATWTVLSQGAVLNGGPLSTVFTNGGQRRDPGAVLSLRLLAGVGHALPAHVEAAMTDDTNRWRGVSPGESGSATAVIATTDDGGRIAGTQIAARLRTASTWIGSDILRSSWPTAPFHGRTVRTASSS